LVIDGDTIEILDADKEAHRIRLHGIDTPERGQPFSRVATEALADIIAGKEVGITVVDTDRYGRTVGVVHFDGQNVNLTLVQDGYAWWYERYAPRDDDLREAQQKARGKSLGLWSEKNPIPPWEWRRGRRE
jgi:endonuclease YncB( thermonuclease family)